MAKKVFKIIISVILIVGIIFVFCTFIPSFNNKLGFKMPSWWPTLNIPGFSKVIKPGDGDGDGDGTKKPGDGDEIKDPDKPGDPSDPDDPDKPSDPDDPEDPKDPEDPDEPDKPEDPEEPDKEIVVTFDANGGMFYLNIPDPNNPGTFIPESHATQTVNVGEDHKITEFTYEPTRAGYSFAGWSSVKYPYTQIDFSVMVFEADTTVYAYWQEDHVVTFDAAGGHIVGQSEYTVTYKNDYILTDSPSDPVRDGYSFAGWSRIDGGEDLVDLDTEKFESDTTLYALWLGVQNIRLNANGGELTSPAQIQTNPDGIIEDFPTDPIREGHSFLCWYMKNSDGDFVGVSKETVFYTFTELIADWTVPCTVYFHANGGTFSDPNYFAGLDQDNVGHITTDTYGKLSGLPGITRNDGYAFVGWSPVKNGSLPVYVNSETVYRSQFGQPVDHHLYAQWANVYKITFDANGGELTDTAEYYTNADGKLSSFPEDPTFPDEPDESDETVVKHIFKGWAFTPTAPIYANTETVFSQDTTLYAIWEERSGSKPDPDPTPGPGPDEPDPDEPEHTHTYSEEWSSDETSHWHEATCEHTGEKSELGEHDTNGANGSCSVCGHVPSKIPEPDPGEDDPVETDPNEWDKLPDSTPQNTVESNRPSYNDSITDYELGFSSEQMYYYFSLQDMQVMFVFSESLAYYALEETDFIRVTTSEYGPNGGVSFNFVSPDPELVYFSGVRYATNDGAKVLNFNSYIAANGTSVTGSFGIDYENFTGKIPVVVYIDCDFNYDIMEHVIIDSGSITPDAFGIEILGVRKVSNNYNLVLRYEQYDMNYYGYNVGWDIESWSVYINSEEFYTSNISTDDMSVTGSLHNYTGYLEIPFTPDSSYSYLDFFTYGAEIHLSFVECCHLSADTRITDSSYSSGRSFGNTYCLIDYSDVTGKVTDFLLLDPRTDINDFYMEYMLPKTANYYINMYVEAFVPDDELGIASSEFDGYELHAGKDVHRGYIYIPANESFLSKNYAEIRIHIRVREYETPEEDNKLSFPVEVLLEVSENGTINNSDISYTVKDGENGTIVVEYDISSGSNISVTGANVDIIADDWSKFPFEGVDGYNEWLANNMTFTPATPENPHGQLIFNVSDLDPTLASLSVTLLVSAA